MPLYLESKYGRYNPILSHVMNTRSDTGAQLGVVGTGYEALNNADAFAFLDSLVTERALKYESAGALRGGRRVWMLARMVDGDFEVTRGDRVVPYLLLSTAHDATAAVRVVPTTIRVVCANTLAAALGDGRAGITVRHDTGMWKRLEAGRMVLKLAGDKMLAVRNAFGRLARTDADDRMVNTLVCDLFPMPMPLSQEWTALSTDRRESLRSLTTAQKTAVKNVYQVHGPPNLWGLLNAVTRWVDHTPSVRNNMGARMNSAWFGAGAALKTQALGTLLKMCN